jgi:hypothetical protein
MLCGYINQIYDIIHQSLIDDEFSYSEKIKSDMDDLLNSLKVVVVPEYPSSIFYVNDKDVVFEYEHKINFNFRSVWGNDIILFNSPDSPLGFLLDNNKSNSVIYRVLEKIIRRMEFQEFDMLVVNRIDYIEMDRSWEFIKSKLANNSL